MCQGSQLDVSEASSRKGRTAEHGWCVVSWARRGGRWQGAQCCRPSSGSAWLRVGNSLQGQKEE